MLGDESFVERPDDGRIVSARPAGLEIGEPAIGMRLGGLLVEDRGVEGVLVREVLKDQRFGDAGRRRNLARRRAAEAVLGEDAARRINQLTAPLRKTEPDLGR